MTQDRPEDREPDEALRREQDEAVRREMERQERIGRFVDHPFLMMLFLSPALRVVVILPIVVAIAAAVAWPRWWTASPAGFTPVVKISLIDLAQARILARSAERLAGEGKDDDAARTWQAALANNPANIEINRAALRHALAIRETGREAAAQAITRADWVLRLSRTNGVDAALAAQVYARFELFPQALALLEPRSDRLSVEEEAAYLKALFHLGRMEDFGARYDRSAARLSADPELVLHHAAFLAGWGPPDRAQEGRERLASAAQDPRHARLVARLRLAICRRALDAQGYADALDLLDQVGIARLEDRIAYWRLLRAVGRGSEARKLAAEYAYPLQTPSEVVQMADGLAALGMVDEALVCLKHYVPQFGGSDSVWTRDMWVTYGSYLIERKLWDELLHMAVQLRTAGRLGQEFEALSHFLEGRALRGLERYEESQAALQQAVARKFVDGPTALIVASDLVKLGMPDLAWAVLEPIENTLAAHPAYWQLRYEIAQALRRDASHLMHAATQARSLAPNDSTTATKYLAALLINRERPDEATELSLRLLGAFPASPSVKVARAAALAQNRRYPEAESLLEEIESRELGETESSLFHLTGLEVAAALGHFEQAQRHLQLIRTNLLFPSQVQWLESARASLPGAR